MQEERELAKWLSGKRYWFGQFLTAFKEQQTAKTKGYTICLRNSGETSEAGWEKLRERVEQKSSERQ